MDDERRAYARYPRHRASVKAARTFARRLAAEWGVDRLADDMELVVSELVTNAIVHAASPWGREVGLTLGLSSQRLRAEVKDGGGGFPCRSAKGAEVDSESGRGMAVIESSTTKWGVTERVVGKSVWADIPIDPGQAAYG